MVSVEKQELIPDADARRLRAMIESLRERLPTSGEPYGSYLRALEARVARMTVVPADEMPNSIVTMNSKVIVRDIETETKQLLTLVYDVDADPFGEKVSVLTPLGTAILGSRIGDTVQCQALRWPRRVRIERIVFQPEAARKFDL
jgi:regulator of nucleoside diphosphate kinase